MISEKYRDLYIATTQEQLKELADSFLVLDKDPNNQQVLLEVFRSLHSMKGAAATMGYKKTVDFIHNLESVVQAAINRNLDLDKKTLDIFFQAIDRLQANLQQLNQTHQELDWRQDNGDLQKILKQSVKVKPSRNKASKVPIKSQGIVSPHVTSELTVTAEQLSQIQNSVDDLLIDVMSIKAAAVKTNQPSILSAVLTADTLVNNLRRQLERLRVVEISQVFSMLPYLVRSVARDENKQVDLIIEDNNLSLDKSILDELLEIVIQLVKNSVVHGIRAGQKNAQIKVSVSLGAEKIIVKVADNGRGIDWQKVRDLAINKKVITSAQAKKLKPAQILNLLFETNISSQRQLNINAGRGVGLSLVKSRVAQLNGQAEVSSILHKGTTFTITLPLSLSIFRSLAIQVGSWFLAIPLSYIDKIVRLDEVRDFSRDKFFVYTKQRFKLLCLLDHLPLPKFKALAKYVLILQTDQGKRALPVYSNLKESELVMKSTPPILKNLKFIRGVAVSSAGHPILILDVNKLN